MPTLPAKQRATSQIQRDMNHLINSLEGLVIDSTLQNESGEGVFVNPEGTVTVKLGDNAGVQKFRITDVDGNEVVYFDSDGGTGLNHDYLAGYVAVRHVDHSAVSVLAGAGLSGGGTLEASRTLALSHLGLQSLASPGVDRVMFWDQSAGVLKWLVPSTGVQITDTNLTTKDSEINHNALNNYAANQHVVLPGTLANVLTDHDLAAHTGLGLFDASSDVDHDATTNYVANKHVNWVDGGQSANLSTTGLITGGNLHTGGYLTATGILADSQVSGLDVILKLGDNAGAKMVRVKDSDDNTVAAINSDGKISGSNLYVSAGALIVDSMILSLGDSLGAKELAIQDSLDNVVATVDSDGNVYAKGALEVDGNVQLDGAQVDLNGTLYVNNQPVFLMAGLSSDGAFSAQFADDAGVYGAYFKNDSGDNIAQILSDGSIDATGRVRVKELASAPSQTANYATFYALSADHKAYVKLSDGTVIEIGSGGGGASDYIENASSEGVYVDADGTIAVKLGENAGAEALSIQNKSAAEVAAIDSLGRIFGKGLYSDGAAVFNESGANVDFRVEGDTQPNLFFVDASAGRVAIGTPSPAATLDVRGSAVFNEDGADVDFRIESDTQANMFFVDAGNNRVGIKTATPFTDFAVEGDAYISGTLRLNDSRIYLRAGTDVNHYIEHDAGTDRTMFGSWSGWRWYSAQHSADAAYLTAGGDMWIKQNCSALTFTDRSPWHGGAALPLLRGVRGEQKRLDHASLPEVARVRTHADVWMREGQIIPEKEAGVIDEHEQFIPYPGVTRETIETTGRDLGMTVSLLIKAVQELEAEIAILRTNQQKGHTT